MASRFSEVQGDWCWLGRVPFAATASLQERLRLEIAAGHRPATLLLCEHDPVITLGRSADASHVLASEAELVRAGVKVERATRGGDVTYHGPGQLVAYPVFPVRRGVVAHVRSMADAIIALLAAHGVASAFRRCEPGVWVGQAKVCAFGVHVHRRVAIHGLALNVNTDLSAFNLIVPCGLRGSAVTSLSALTGAQFAPEQIVGKFIAAASPAFGLELVQVDQSVIANHAHSELNSDS